MAVQILNDMPDAEIHRGEAFSVLGALAPQRRHQARWWFTGRAGFIACTAALHFAAFAGLVSVHRQPKLAAATPIIASFIDAPAAPTDAPPEYVPRPQEITYALPEPQVVIFETDPITPPVTTTAISEPAAQTLAPAMIDSVEYVRAPAPVYPSESNRRRERGTVLLRVMVDSLGRPAEIQIERSSGFARLDTAARVAVAKALFRPYEVNGVAQPAQVLVPIEFTRRAT